MDYQSQFGMQVDRDVEHLKILSICWYVASGMGAFFGCVPIIHVTMGLMLILRPGGFGGGGGGGPPPAILGWMFLIMGSVLMLMMWTGAILAFITARSLPQRRRIIFCYVAAGLVCLQIPVGTVLGIFTFIVLSRPNVRASFNRV